MLNAPIAPLLTYLPETRRRLGCHQRHPSALPTAAHPAQAPGRQRRARRHHSLLSRRLVRAGPRPAVYTGLGRRRQLAGQCLPRGQCQRRESQQHAAQSAQTAHPAIVAQVRPPSPILRIVRKDLPAACYSPQLATLKVGRSYSRWRHVQAAPATPQGLAAAAASAPQEPSPHAQALASTQTHPPAAAPAAHTQPAANATHRLIPFLPAGAPPLHTQQR